LGIWISFNIQSLDKNHINWSSLNPFKMATEETIAPEKVNIAPLVPIQVLIEQKKASMSENTSKANEIVTDKKETPANLPAEVIKAQQEPVASSNGSYYIIGGCFGVLENANRFVSQLKAKGYNASVCGQNANGLNMVTYDTFSSAEEANQVLKEIHQQNPDAWVFVKR
jgi:cell division septation protein DedD